ncbi:hypothetical protein MTO96_034663 [Rhipicephalus appendiculatus]
MQQANMRPAWRSPTRQQARGRSPGETGTRGLVRGRLCFRQQWRRGPGAMGPFDDSQTTPIGDRAHVTAAVATSRPSNVSAGQYKTRHTFLAQATSADVHAFALTRRWSSSSCIAEW